MSTTTIYSPLAVEIWMPVDARDLSCQGLADVDPGALDFHGRPVEGYAAEVARRGDGHVSSCDLIGHLCDPAK